MKGFFKSSIGKKLVMSVSGLFLILFLLFHMCMNVFAVIGDGSMYDAICGFLGANWYAVAGTGVLALGVIVHIIMATKLTIENRKARGNDRYDNQNLPAGVEWSSKNMFVLGAVVILGLALHFVHFWSKMMYAELAGAEEVVLCNGATVTPTSGAAIVKYTFSQWYNLVIYLLWFAALWFHLNHGFWSAFHTLGASNSKWIPRLKCLSTWVTSIIIAVFAAVAIIAFIQA